MGPARSATLRVLFSPLGLAYGSLFSAIVLTRPDRVVVLTSARAAADLETAVAAARAEHPAFAVERYLLDDPFAGFLEGRQLAEEIARAWAGRTEAEFVVNLAGGTTALQYAVQCIGALVGARMVAVVDRRSSEEQRREPVRVGELVELPPVSPRRA